MKYKERYADVPPCSSKSLEYLQLGCNLIKWPEPFPIEKAESAWHLHREAVIEDWERQCAEFRATTPRNYRGLLFFRFGFDGACPPCWAELEFDKPRRKK